MHEIQFTLNGSPVTVTANPLKRLIDVLREDLGMTGVKEGCGEGECGACSILRNGKIVNSCIMLVGMIEGDEILTPEGLSAGDRGKAINEGYAQAGAVQCGICMPGMAIATEALLKENPTPNDHEIRVGISGNLCRCTGYDLIVKGVHRAAELGKDLW